VYRFRPSFIWFHLAVRGDQNLLRIAGHFPEIAFLENPYFGDCGRSTSTVSGGLTPYLTHCVNLIA
jgi:hypothetical protein